MKSERQKMDDVKLTLAILFLLAMFFAKEFDLYHRNIPKEIAVKYENYQAERKQEKIDLIREAIYGKQE